MQKNVNLSGKNLANFPAVKKAATCGVRNNTSSHNKPSKVARAGSSQSDLMHHVRIWAGELPKRSNNDGNYSRKVFLGGIPWGATDSSLMDYFKQFKPIQIKWLSKMANPWKSYAYIVFRHEDDVKSLLKAHATQNDGEWFCDIPTYQMRKKVQIVPWMLSDSNYLSDLHSKQPLLDPKKTIFVGKLHGKLNAEGLARIMNDLFGGVVYVSFRTGRFKYPTGLGRVGFSNNQSCKKAVSAAFITVETPEYTSNIEVTPFLEESLCSVCAVHEGPYFCRDFYCLKYFCKSCWQAKHSSDSNKWHHPLEVSSLLFE